jgi:hypothetical protein
MNKLPKIDLPISEIELPSTGEKVKFRSFTVKEEKILLIAQESDDPEQEILAMKQIIGNCLIDADVNKFAMFDLEYILLAIRSRSVDNAMNFTIKDPDTNELVDLEIDIANISLVRDEKHKTKIKINDSYTLTLKYPTIDEFTQIIQMNPNDPLVNYFIMITCLDKLYSEDEVFDLTEYTNDEIDEFMDGMSGDVMKGIKDFFETMPKVRHEMKYKNKNGKDKTFVIEGMRTFFI